MLKVREVMWEQYGRLHKLLVQIVGRDELCRRYLRIPGVGPVTALAFKPAMDEPTRARIIPKLPMTPIRCMPRARRRLLHCGG